MKFIDLFAPVGQERHMDSLADPFTIGRCRKPECPYGRSCLRSFGTSLGKRAMAMTFTSSAAGWPARRPPGSWPKPGLKVRLSEMRGGGDMTPAHETDRLAEMVCSNSFRSDDAENNAVGLLHQEMRALGSLIMAAADQHKVPAGSALAVDREGFAAEVTHASPPIPTSTVVRERVDALPASGPTIIATGPLTAPGLAERHRQVTGSDALAFFDAIAPIVHRDSIDMDVCWMAARWDKGGKDYINCPMDKEQYEAFVAALNEGEKTEFKEWEKDTPYFEGCMPIEVMASRGPETLRFGPMKGSASTIRAPAAGPMPWSSCARTMRSARCGTWSASRPS
jgi:tRNA:m(5)U-54 methyltransferase